MECSSLPRTIVVIPCYDLGRYVDDAHLQGVLLGNPWLIFIFLSAVNLGVISTAFLIAIYSRNVKEASIGLMLLYVMVSIFLVLSLSLEYINPQKFLEISPFVVISRLAIGESVGAVTMASLFLSFFVYSGLVLSFCARLLSRDDVVFGPRPSFFELYSQWMEGILVLFGGRPLLGVS